MNDYEDDGYSYDREDVDREGPLGEEGCCFPGECCMPGFHYKSECHTSEMLMQQEEELRKKT